MRLVICLFSAQGNASLIFVVFRQSTLPAHIVDIDLLQNYKSLCRTHAQEITSRKKKF